MKERVLKLVARLLGGAARKMAAKLPPTTLVVGVTGSSGKTSTKEAIGELVKITFGDNALVSSGNLNNEIGLPLALLGYSEVPSAWQYPIIVLGSYIRAWRRKPLGAYVLEYAVDRPGDMDGLISIIRPNVAVITNIASVHLENYSSLEELVSEKLKIALNLPGSGVVVYNGDDDNLTRHINKLNLSCRQITFGSGKDNDIRLLRYKLESNKTEFSISVDGKERDYSINALGEQHIMATLPAVVVAKLMELSHETVAKALENYVPLPGRGNIIFGVKDSVIINDTYNANPLSTEKMLNVLNNMPAPKKVAVLGDMLELGDHSKYEHERILTIAKKSANLVVTVGRRMAESKIAHHSFLSPMEAAQFLKDHLDKGTVLAVKGSQSMRMEYIVKELMLDQQKADELLPRQNDTWRSKPFELV